MATLQYESLPQRPPRASRRQHKLAPAVALEEEERAGGGATGGGDEEMVPATTTTTTTTRGVNASSSADRPPSSSKDESVPASDAANAAAAAAAAHAAVTPRGPLEGARAKRARDEDRENDDGMEREEEQADVAAAAAAAGGDNDNGTPPSTSAPPSGFSRAQAVPGFDFEYLDHTADIQIHSWGASLEAAFCSAGLGMVNYMTPLEGLAAVEERRFSASGHDLDTLLFSFLDELLFAFSTEGFAARELCVLGGIDRGAFSLEAVGKGERFDRERHSSGTEVKAITYSAMRIVEGAEKDKGADVWVIVDI